MLDVRQVTREEAGRMIRAAYRRNPSHRETGRRLARYLFVEDALEEQVEQFKPLLDASAPDPECLHYLGLAAFAMGDSGLAERAFERAVAVGNAESRGPWARVLHESQKTSEAYAIARETLEQNPEDDWSGLVVFKTLLVRKRQTELWDLCGRLRAGGRWTPRMASALALAARTPDELAFVQRMTDKEIWVEHRSLGLEPSWMRELAGSLSASDRWTGLPRAKATVGSGRRIEVAHIVAGNVWLDAIFQHIQAAIADYVEKRADLLALPPDDQPMAAMKPDQARLVSWVVSVHGVGHEDWHIHPDGWLSGVFYVEMPDLSESDAPHAGQIEFGPLPLGAPGPVAAWPGFRLQPRAGDLILFPSYFAHRTWPTHLAKDRVCIAFDVLRRGFEDASAAAAPQPPPARIGLDQRIARDGRAISVPDDRGWRLVMNVDSGDCVAMDDAGALIWSLLETPRTAREMVSLIVRDFEGGEAEIQKDVSDALDHMVKCGVAAVA
ncbi:MULTISPECIES: PqqD family peptide modification chaperone [Hyphomicrobiales]|uniref:PqqD family peptide modification chaperone n=1 Tax=Hyphomicrobiales TaxID=356 RepID=UPI003F9CE22D